MTTTMTQTAASRAYAGRPTSSAPARSLPPGPALEPLWSPLVIRLATAGDQQALQRLAELDSARAPAGTTLIAELRGRPVAAVSLGDGEQIADPFVPTADITELLRIRARQLTHSGH
jgi:hypothetical protein